jgi:hypothetical protein
MGEHALIGGTMLIARYEQRADFSASKQAVDSNTQQFASQMESLYGVDTKDKFLTIWTNHVNAFLNYADARRLKDNARATLALESLQKFTDDFSSLLAQEKNVDSYMNAQNYFARHVLNEKAILDAFIDKNYQKMYTSMHEAYLHDTLLSKTILTNFLFPSHNFYVMFWHPKWPHWSFKPCIVTIFKSKRIY